MEAEILSAASPALDLAYILKLPDEILLLILNVLIEKASNSRDNPTKWARLLAGVCRRFRAAFVHRVYREISISQTATTKSIPLLHESLELNGNMTLRLDLWLQPEPLSGLGDIRAIENALDGFGRCLKRLPNLRNFSLHFYPDGSLGQGYDHLSDTPPPPDTRSLTKKGLASLSFLFSALPKELEVLQTTGFNWKDWSAAMTGVTFPNLRQLSWDLELPAKPTLSSADFLSRMPRITNLSIPTGWCPTSKWFQRAFPALKIEQLSVGHGSSKTHPCTKECLWVDSLAHIFRTSASTLTHLTISTFAFDSETVSMYCHNLETLKVTDLNFEEYEDDILEGLIGAFMTLRISSLHFLSCEQVPESLAQWFGFAERKRFLPALKRLELRGGFDTETDRIDLPDIPDDEWDSDEQEYDSLANPDREMPYYWRPQTRRKFEEDCKLRGITATIDWEWNEGMG